MYQNPPVYFWSEDAKRARLEEINNSLTKQFKEATKGRQPTPEENQALFRAASAAYDTVYNPTQEQRWAEYVANASKIEADFAKMIKGRKPTPQMFEAYNDELTAAYVGAMMDLPRYPKGQAPQLPPPPAGAPQDDDIPLPPPLEQHPDYGVHPPKEPYPYDRHQMNRGKQYDPRIGLSSRDQPVGSVLVAPSGAEMAVMSRPTPEDLNSAFNGVKNIFQSIYSAGVQLSDEQVQAAAGEVLGLWSKHKIEPPCPLVTLLNIFRTINVYGSQLSQLGASGAVVQQHLVNASESIVSGDKDRLLNVMSSLGVYSTANLLTAKGICEGIMQQSNAQIGNVMQGGQALLAQLSLERDSLIREKKDCNEELIRTKHAKSELEREKGALLQKFQKFKEESEKKLKQKDEILTAAEEQAYKEGQKATQDEYAKTFNTMKESNINLGKRIVQLEEQNAELDAQIIAVKTIITANENFQGTLAQAADYCVKKVEKLEENLKNEKKAKRELENAISNQEMELKQEIASLEDQLQKEKEAFASYKGDAEVTVKEYEDQYESDQSEISMLKLALEAAKTETASKVNEIASLRVTLQSKVEPEEKKALEDRIADLRKESSASNAKVKLLERDISEKTRQSEEVYAKIAKYEAELKSRQTAMDIMEEKYKKLVTTNDQMASTQLNLQNSLDLKNQTINELKKQNSDLAKENLNLNEVIRQSRLSEAKAQEDAKLVDDLKKQLDETKKLKDKYIPTGEFDMLEDPNMDAMAGLVEPSDVISTHLVDAGSEVPPIPVGDQTSIFADSMNLTGVSPYNANVPKKSTTAKRRPPPKRPPPPRKISTSGVKRIRLSKQAKSSGASRERNLTRGGYVVGGRPDPNVSPYGKDFWRNMYLSHYHLF